MEGRGEKYLIQLDEFDFKIDEEIGICQFTLKPKDNRIKKIVFYSPMCSYCQEYIAKLTEKAHVVNINDSPLLSTHFNIRQVPYEMYFE